MTFFPTLPCNITLWGGLPCGSPLQWRVKPPPRDCNPDWFAPGTFLMTFSASISDLHFICFLCFFDHVLDEFSMKFELLFQHIFVCFWRVAFFKFPIYLISFVFGEPSPTRILLHESYGFRTSIFSENSIFR